MVKIKNVSSSTVIISIPELSYRRQLAPGRTVAATKEDYDQMIFDSGFAALAKLGYLQISGESAEETAIVKETIPVSGSIVDMAEIRKIFEKRDVAALSKIVKEASYATKENIVKLAVEMDVTHNGMVAMIDKYCDTDIITAITRKHEVQKSKE